MMRAAFALLPAVLALAACNSDPTGKSESAPAEAAGGDPLTSRDAQQGQALDPAMADDQPRPMMQMQVVLDRLGFTPGVVDGKMGLSTRNAITGFQEANGMETTGEPDPATKQALARWSNIPATRVVTIPAEFAQGPFRDIPEDAAAQAKLDRLGYESLEEKLAERFHTTVETLRMLNPGAGAGAAPSRIAPTSAPSASASGAAVQSVFRAGQPIRVPNVGADRIDPAAVEDARWRQTLTTLGVGTQQPEAAKIVVSKSKGTLRVYDADDKLVGMYTATMGSEHDPLPLGEWKVLGVAHNPPFAYNPDLFWDVPDSEAQQMLPPGPNGPVGVVWIDLSKEHYGIHGTPEPQTIGRAQSHGCVRLTNWDAARLAQMVSSGTQVLFEA